MGQRASGPDPTRPIGSGRDAQVPTAPVGPPPSSKVPVLVITGVIVLALVVLAVGGVAAWRADQAQQSPSIPQPTRTGSMLPPNVRPFVTETCDDGLFEVLNHERVGTNLYLEIRITCVDGSYRVMDDAIAVFDKESISYRNQVPSDRETLGNNTIRNGETVQGWASFSGVPSGEVTVLLLGYRRTITAVPLDT